MNRHSWSVQDAKNQFSAVVEAARSAPQTVTKHGKPAVVVVNAEEYERLRKLEQAKAPSFKDHLLAMPKDDGSFERMEVEFREVDF
jgi:antitoxin Phd